MEINVNNVSIHARIAHQYCHVHLVRVVIFYQIINVYNVYHHVKLVHLYLFVYHVGMI